MTKLQYIAIEAIQVDMMQLSALLAWLARGIDGPTSDAVAACATLAGHIGDQVDDVPGFLDAQMQK